MGAFGGRGGLRVGQARRDPGQRSVLTDGQVLRVGAAAVSSYPNTRSPTAKHVTLGPTASTCPANSLPRIVTRGRDEPCEGPGEERRSTPEPAVGAVHRRRVDLDEHLVVPGAGVGTSITRTTSGGPYRVCTAAFIHAP